MHRKNFLSSLLSLGAGIPFLSFNDDNAAPPKIPKYLKPGDTIGITAPAGHITAEEIRPSVIQMESWGFRIKVGSTIGKTDFTFAGTDQERAADFQEMLDDPTIKAIMCARGGYGMVRIIDKLDFTKFIQKPKWVIGFSDLTVFHSHINRNHGIASIHSKMCNSFPDDWSKAEQIQIETINSIRQALNGEKMKYFFDANPSNKPGKAEGVLVGGNLKTIESLAGSSSDLYTAGKILFVEDTGEYLYSIDRMFWNLKRTGKLSQLKALIVGGFKIKTDDEGESFGRTLQDIVLEKIKKYDYPVCFDFPVGHQKNNYALKCGVIHKLDVKEEKVSLLEK
ncbi:MAG TPA: LD-carboxypeptidase [Chitinophagaceae bacterium]|nr:LD-carboxypeptidase [Chitinophagaceae bacterium]